VEYLTAFNVGTSKHVRPAKMVTAMMETGVELMEVRSGRVMIQIHPNVKLDIL
jgi:hypothetical protein